MFLVDRRFEKIFLVDQLFEKNFFFFARPIFRPKTFGRLTRREAGSILKNSFLQYAQ
jgi:hypothetical protein